MTEQELTRDVIIAAIAWTEDLDPLERIDGFYSEMDGRGVKLDQPADRLIRATIALRKKMRENAAGVVLP